MLEVLQVSKEYPTARGPLSILREVTLTFRPGDAVAITGPSGSGKSTLLYLLGGLEPPTEGEIRLDGQNPYQLNERELAAYRNRQVGFVFQDHHLLPQCTVLENVLIPTLVRPAEEGGRESRARYLLGAVGLLDRLDHRPAELSGGEKQRVAIARALIGSPRLLLCDEPTGNLDPASAAAVADLLLDLHRREQTILLVVTHSAELAARFPIHYQMRGGALQPAS
ncbi:MAG: ABC transporter ATP-binding protein [Blastocatellia bacterium]